MPVQLPKPALAALFIAARDQLDAPYVDGGRDGRRNGNGLDSVGFILNCVDAAGISPADPKNTYDNPFAPDALHDWLTTFCERVTLPRAGDILLKNWEPHKLGPVNLKRADVRLLLADDRVIGPYWGRPCTESRLSPFWCKGAAYFRPNFNDCATDAMPDKQVAA